MPALNPQTLSLPRDLEDDLRRLCDQWEQRGNLQRLWSGDASLWTGAGEENWLGWLRIVDQQLGDIARLRALAADIRGRYTDAILLGMGGSSLCPEVLRLCFGTCEGFPDLQVLDSTDPAQIRACEDSAQLESTLFFSASKSGSTLETALLTRYFLDRLSRRVGTAQAGKQFVAVTDPGSRLEELAADRGFGHVFRGVPEIGGRYSALSHFGLAPAAAMGLDVEALLHSARSMCEACAADSQPSRNPGLRLGLLLGAAARKGRDKLTFVVTPGSAPLGAWIEQLVAESTGKLGLGIVPVDGEPLGSPDSYGDDRIFAQLVLGDESDPEQDAKLAGLRSQGHPVARIAVQETRDIGQEFFRWEFATAVAGAVLGINPFDQPDVESSKVGARELTGRYEADGTLPSGDAFLTTDGMRLFAAPGYARRLVDGIPEPTPESVLQAHLGNVGAGDYFALLAYLPRVPACQAALARIRAAARARLRVATCVGFGPRFLHSTGQLHKGGAGNGVFVQLGCEDVSDLPVPDSGLTFGVVQAAQAQGDFEVLARLGRRALRIQLNGCPDQGLARLESAFAAAQ